LAELKRRFQLPQQQQQQQQQDKEKNVDKGKEEDRNRQVAVRAQSNLPVIDFLKPVTVHANWMVGTDDKVGSFTHSSAGDIILIRY